MRSGDRQRELILEAVSILVGIDQLPAKLFVGKTVMAPFEVRAWLRLRHGYT
jgi:hypothetical protein